MEINESVSDRDLVAIVAGQSVANKYDKMQLSLAELFGYAEQQLNKGKIGVGEKREKYVVHPKISAAKELITRCMLSKISTENEFLVNSPNSVKTFLAGKLGHLKNEVFAVLFLDNKHRVLSYDVLFKGTVASCHIEPREVVRMALLYNSAAVIFAHNHPSRSEEPSQADKDLTDKLKSILNMVDIRVLDHFIVSANVVISMQEIGLV